MESQHKFQQLLGSIVSRAQRNIAHLQHSPSPAVSPPVRTSLTLPNPVPIVDHLLSLGCEDKVAQCASAVYLRNADQLKSSYERDMNETINHYLRAGELTRIPTNIPAVFASYKSVYTRALTEWVELAEQQVLPFVAVSRARSALDAKERRKVFKQDVAPFLEKEFLLNPYPIRLEKERMAHRVGLSYKEVDIWFQNRRSRAKRQGKDIQRLSFVVGGPPQGGPKPESVPPKLSFSQFLRPKVDEGRVPASPLSPCPFRVTRPPYAFPTIFSPISDYSPSPVSDIQQSFDTPWLRHTVIHHSRDKAGNTLPNVEQLCAPLSQLSLSEERFFGDIPTQKATNQTRRLRDYTTACFPVLVRPPSAPLPALVPASVTVSTTAVEHGTSFSRILAKHVVHVTAPPAPPTSSTERVSTRVSSHTSSRRIHRHLQESARDSVHPYNPGKFPKSRPRRAKLSRLSSTSSLSSLASDDSCSSRASSASVESPLPVTPPLLPTPLPQFIKVTVPDVIFSPSQDLDRLFGDTNSSGHNLLTHRQAQLVQ